MVARESIGFTVIHAPIISAIEFSAMVVRSMAL